ncbi:phosphonate C-P lyase system protein PhnL [Notoacmeibacter sp. MSK16QG-6]|uniref:phosphonate C-P lyase system protein PhnL n=1 Tax=Notoacmeibacter sp. MSK16QG-6 TaxID=2957982 RepID=UPI00209E30C2|nr:phosphonate C-P lyase system protein PhnL [Notoacmeibacter sp. MSK16QG-6]MCP1201125.1 phosphonate C-P lyase system protein PhnL [Notoacmeibacter sp. MSK16QG-6]
MAKSFTMHLQGGRKLPVLDKACFSLEAGQCAVLAGPSGVGKSSILKMIYGNYVVNCGTIAVWHDGDVLDIAKADPRTMMAVRKRTIGYVSQFLSVVPRVSTRDIVAEPMIARGIEKSVALSRAETLLERLNLPRRLFDLPPATFSGGEQQRVNIARGFSTDHPILLLDEPTASLDNANRDVVLEIIEEKKATGVALLGIFHDLDTRRRVADKLIDVSAFAPSEAA